LPGAQAAGPDAVDADAADDHDVDDIFDA